MQRVAFVSASSSGFGFEIALDLSKKGYIVILNGRDAESLARAKSQLHNKERHYTFCCDLTTKEMLKELDDFFTYNKLLPNILIHALGGKFDQDMHPIDLDIFGKTMHLNLGHAIAINNYFTPQFQATKEIQKIIHVSSSASLRGNASPCYAMSKAALNIYIKNSARYYALDAISFCGIIPNIIIHKGSDWAKKKEQDREYYDKRVQEMPLKEFATPQNLSPYITALCDIQSMHDTGSLIELQGGV